MIVRTVDDTDIDRLKAAGAAEVVAEELAEQRMDYLGPDGASLTADEAKEVTAILDER